MKRVNASFALILLLLVSFTAVFGQSNEWFHFTPNDRIEHIAQTGNNLWVHTVDGFVKFDMQTGEKRFFDKTHPVTISEQIHGLARLGDGGVIIVVTYDLGVLEITDTSWMYFDTTNSVIPSYDVISISSSTDYSSVWMATQSKLALIQYSGNRRWNLYHIPEGPLPDSVQTILVDHQDHIWVGTSRRLLRFDGQNWTDFTAELRAAGAGRVWVQHLYEDTQQQLWMGIAGDLYHMNGENWELVASNLGKIEMNQDASGTYWITSRPTEETAFVYTYSPQGLMPLTPENSNIPFSTYRALFRDDEGNLWLGGFPGELTRYKDGQFERFDLSNSEMKVRNTLDIAHTPDDKIWVLSENKLLIHQNQSWNQMPLPRYLGDRMLVQDEAHIWILNPASTELSAFIQGSWHTYDTSNLFDAQTKLVDMVLDEANNVWVLAQKTLYRWNGQKWDHFDASNSNFPNLPLAAIVAGNEGQVWLADERAAGLYVFNGSSFRRHAHPEPLLERSTQVILNRDQQGRLWIYSDAGLFHFNGSGFFAADVDFPIDGISTGTDQLILMSGSSLRFYDGTHITSVLTPYNSSLRRGRPAKVITDAYGNYWISNRDELYGGLSIYNPKGINNMLTSAAAALQPEQAGLSAFPNPFRHHITFEYELASPAPVQLRLYDLSGRLVEKLVQPVQAAGRHRLRWTPTGQAAGMYLARLQAGTLQLTQKIILTP